MSAAPRWPGMVLLTFGNRTLLTQRLGKPNLSSSCAPQNPHWSNPCLESQCSLFGDEVRNKHRCLVLPCPEALWCCPPELSGFYRGSQLKPWDSCLDSSCTRVFCGPINPALLTIPLEPLPLTMDSTLGALCTSCEVNSATQEAPLLFLWGWGSPDNGHT